MNIMLYYVISLNLVLHHDILDVISFILMLQHDILDAAFLRDFSDGFGLDDDNLIEIVCTRTNAELQVCFTSLSHRILA